MPIKWHQLACLRVGKIIETPDVAPGGDDDLELAHLSWHRIGNILMGMEVLRLKDRADMRHGRATHN